MKRVQEGRLLLHLSSSNHPPPFFPSTTTTPPSQLDPSGNIITPPSRPPPPPLSDPWSVIGNLASLSGIRCSLRLYSSSLPLITRAHQLLKSSKSTLSKNPGYKSLTLTVLEVLGDCHAGLGDFGLARGYAEECVELGEETCEFARVASACESLAHMEGRVRKGEGGGGFPSEKEVGLWMKAGEVSERNFAKRQVIRFLN